MSIITEKFKNDIFRSGLPKILKGNFQNPCPCDLVTGCMVGPNKGPEVAQYLDQVQG